MTDHKNAPAKTPRKRSVKSRTRSGCNTCKIRHVKCDESKPICARCRQFDYKCEGYAYGSPNTTIGSSSRAFPAPPMPIARVHSQQGSRGEIRASSGTAPRISQGGAVPVPRLYTRSRVDFDPTHSDDSQSSSSTSPTRTERNSDPSPTLGTDNELVVSDDQRELRQEVELRHLIKESPLSPKPSPTSDEYIEKAFRFSVQRALPGLLFNHTSGTDESSCHAWIRLAVENPAALQVRLYSAELYHRALFHQPLNPTTDLLAIYADAIILLNEQLKDPATACSDGNLLAVGGLGFFGQSRPKPQPVSSLPAQGPLQDLQRLHVYSQMVYDPMHRRGLDLLIKTRGGLDKFKTHGLAAVTSYGDIINATENLCPPRHFFAPMLDTPVIPDIQVPDNFTKTRLSLQNLGSGFPTSWQNSNIPSLQNLFTVLQSMATYTRIVYSHTQGIDIQENMGKLADMRNFVQHSLLSIPPSDKLLPAILDPLYEATRLASLICSLLIIFPIHAPRAPFAELASQLQSNLSFLNSDKQKETELLLWILVMGAIAGMNTANRIWFVCAIREVASRLRVERWEELRGVLESFLWFGITNDRDGRIVWREAEGAEP